MLYHVTETLFDDPAECDWTVIEAYSPHKAAEVFIDQLYPEQEVGDIFDAHVRVEPTDTETAHFTFTVQRVTTMMDVNYQKGSPFALHS